MPYLDNKKVIIVAGIFSQPNISYKEAVSKLKEAGMDTIVEIRNDPDKKEPDICIDIKSGKINVLNISVPLSQSMSGVNWVKIISGKLERFVPTGNQGETDAKPEPEEEKPATDKPVVKKNWNAALATAKENSLDGTVRKPAAKPEDPKSPGEKTVKQISTGSFLRDHRPTRDSKTIKGKQPLSPYKAARTEQPSLSPDKQAQTDQKVHTKTPETNDAGRERKLDLSLWGDDTWDEESQGVVADEYEAQPEAENTEKKEEPKPVKKPEPSVINTPTGPVRKEVQQKPAEAPAQGNDDEEQEEDTGEFGTSISSLESSALIGNIMESIGEMSDAEIENCAIESWNEEGAGYSTMIAEQAKKEEEKKAAERKKIKPFDPNKEESKESDIGAPSEAGEVDMKKITQETDFSMLDDMF